MTSFDRILKKSGKTHFCLPYKSRNLTRSSRSARKRLISSKNIFFLQKFLRISLGTKYINDFCSKSILNIKIVREKDFFLTFYLMERSQAANFSLPCTACSRWWSVWKIKRNVCSYEAVCFITDLAGRYVTVIAVVSATAYVLFYFSTETLQTYWKQEQRSWYYVGNSNY